jgi:hypothetical protein
VSAADLCLALALSALLSVVVAAAQYMRAEKAEAEVERLTAERDALAQIKRHIDEVRNGTGWTVQIYGVLLQQCDQYGKTIDTRRAERAEAERDALAATGSPGFEALTEAVGSDLAATAIMVNSREWLQACAGNHQRAVVRVLEDERRPRRVPRPTRATPNRPTRRASEHDEVAEGPDAHLQGLRQHHQ